MSALTVVPIYGASWRGLLEVAPPESAHLDDQHRRQFAERFGDLGTALPQRLDAWSVERPATSPFAWSPRRARRSLGNAALRRLVAGSPSVREAVEDVITDRLLSAAAGLARPGTLAHWLSSLAAPTRAIVIGEAATWATSLVELSQALEAPWHPAPADAYYAIAGARTSLRAAREIIVTGPTRVVVRVRAGSPGRSAGAGLRADLAIDALAHPHGELAGRLVGVWPEAGLALAVEGTLEDARVVSI